jgi:hypothetical protein
MKSPPKPSSHIHTGFSKHKDALDYYNETKDSSPPKPLNSLGEIQISAWDRAKKDSISV